MAASATNGSQHTTRSQLAETMRLNGVRKPAVGKRQSIFLRFGFYFLGLSLVSVTTLISFFVSIHSQSSVSECSGKSVASVLAGSRSSLYSSTTTTRTTRLAYLSDQLPSYKHSLKDPPSDAPYNILHTVTTRFMVGQPSDKTNSYHLAKARYHLFETFCWPTVKHQTLENFYWIVLVDPGVEQSIIQNIQRLLSREHFPEGNAFLVLTNNTDWASDGIGVENSNSYGVGLQPIAEEYIDGKLEIITGNHEYLSRALEIMNGKGQRDSGRTSGFGTEKPIMVVETLLDADDGLNNNAVEWIQTVATKRTAEHAQQQQQQQQTKQSVSPSLNTSWWFLCGTDHIEWHNREIYKISKEAYSEIGISSGLVGLRQSPLFCTSAGFTRIGITAPSSSNNYGGGSSSYSHMKFPKDAYSNHALTFYFPECTPPSSRIVATGNYSACWHREFPGEAFILKSRTITSDSMDHMNPRRSEDYRDVAWLNKTDYPLLINETEKMWKILGQDFSVDRIKAWETSVFLYENREAILRENKFSRCTPGFPCYKEAKRNHIRMQKYWKTQADQAKVKAKTEKMHAPKNQDAKTPPKKKHLPRGAQKNPAKENPKKTSTRIGIKAPTKIRGERT